MVKQVVFEDTSSTQDWVWQYRLLQEGHEVWNDDEEIVLGMSPDYAAWDDYGVRSRSFPLVSHAYDSAPFFQSSSKDGTGVVLLTNPNLIEIRVPYNVMRQMGPGTCHVSLSWRRIMPEVEPIIPDPELVEPAKREHKARVWAKRLGVPVALVLTEMGVPVGATSRTTLVTGTLPVIDGVV